MLNKISINLENCYGIKALKADIAFEHGRVAAIYAPNGSMKTSFAHVFKDLSGGGFPEDRIYKDAITVCEVTDEAGDAIPSKNIFVIESLNDEFKSKITSSLLVNKKLKKEHDEITAGIKEKQDELFKSIKKLSKLTKGNEEEFCLA